MESLLGGICDEVFMNDGSSPGELKRIPAEQMRLMLQEKPNNFDKLCRKVCRFKGNR